MMKKIGLFVLGLCLFAGASAQQGFHVGLLGMPQNTWIFNKTDSDAPEDEFAYEFTWGLSGMFKLGYNFADPIGIHTGVIYSKQGQDATGSDTLIGSFSTSRELNYIKIPLLLHINSDPGPVMFTFEMGPQIGILMNASTFFNENLIQYPFENELIYSPTDLSFTWSIGAEICFNEWFHFIIQHRGDYSILDVEDKGFSFQNLAFWDSERKKSFNGNFGIMGGFNFCFNPSGSGRSVKFWFR